MTVAGCLARGEHIRGVCKTTQCRRTITLDLVAQASVGFGKTEIRALQEAWRCRVAEGCQIKWDAGFHPAGVPLQSYVGSNARIVVACANCGFTRTLEPQQLIDRLKQRRAGDGNTSVLKVAAAIRGPCPSCKVTHWKADLVWTHAAGQGPAPRDRQP